MDAPRLKGPRFVEIHPRLWVVLCAVAGCLLAMPGKDRATAGNSAAVVDFRAVVNAVHEIPPDNPMPGLHLRVKVKGRTMDVYVAPAAFLAQYGVKVSRGDQVHIVGSQTRVGEAEVVLAREITVGPYTNGTLYLRNDDGPLWDETKPAGTETVMKPN